MSKLILISYIFELIIYLGLLVYTYVIRYECKRDIQKVDRLLSKARRAKENNRLRL